MCCIYAQRLVCYKIFVWWPQLILWPLVRQLHFVINDRNKCVTSSLGEWRPSYNDDHKFLVLHNLWIFFVYWDFAVHFSYCYMIMYYFSPKLVKSGYHVAKRMRKEENHSRECLVQRANNPIWSRIWKAKVPNKVKIFSWRACQNIFPT